ncbi:uncharacterized protein J4E92_010534 [Alternaria infectoria]|uniref:uncharacterized protein n=1 Tax=Alternaria infectoria TaxID=45303 RepID=UPI00221F5CF5|nr:uncharacterized protein J4E92_010534 [Alternaria infectoria]KAI4909918.1 hypothetical protein J4E92_010534 [Alternaria infectoria]
MARKTKAEKAAERAAKKAQEEAAQREIQEQQTQERQAREAHEQLHAQEQELREQHLREQHLLEQEQQHQDSSEHTDSSREASPDFDQATLDEERDQVNYLLEMNNSEFLEKLPSNVTSFSRAGAIQLYSKLRHAVQDLQDPSDDAWYEGWEQGEAETWDLAFAAGFHRAMVLTTKSSKERSKVTQELKERAEGLSKLLKGYKGASEMPEPFTNCNSRTHDYCLVKPSEMVPNHIAHDYFNHFWKMIEE